MTSMKSLRIPSYRTSLTCRPDVFSHSSMWAFLRSRRGWRGARRRGRPGSITLIDQILQFLTRLEEWDLLSRHLDALAGLGIPAHARFALTRAEAAKAADLNLVARAQRAHHAVKDGFHNHFAVFARKLRQTRDFVNQIGFGHNPSFASCFSLNLHNLLKFQGFFASPRFV